MLLFVVRIAFLGVVLVEPPESSSSASSVFSFSILAVATRSESALRIRIGVVSRIRIGVVSRLEQVVSLFVFVRAILSGVACYARVLADDPSARIFLVESEFSVSPPEWNECCCCCCIVVVVVERSPRPPGAVLVF